MKKIVSVILLLCTLFSLAVLAGCSEGEPVPYTEKLMKGRDCYVDVIEVIPATDIRYSYYFYCECVLESGERIFMEIDPSDYVEYFDEDAVSYDIRYTARAVKYDEPVRLTGKAGRRKVATDALSEEKRSLAFFSFVESDKEKSLDSAEKSDASIPFDKEMKEDIHVYADIMSISPEYTVTTASSYFLSVICKCTLANKEEMWMLISKRDYAEYFDSSASFDNQPGLSSTSTKRSVVFATPARVYGMTERTEDEFSYNEGTVPDVIFEFKGADKEQVTASKLSNQKEIAYTGTERVDTPVYVDIVSVKPEYRVSSWTDPLSEYYVCSCVATDGSKVWMIISKVNYMYSFLNDDSTVKTFPEGVRVNGVICLANDQASELAETIDQETLIMFRTIGK